MRRKMLWKKSLALLIVSVMVWGCGSSSAGSTGGTNTGAASQESGGTQADTGTEVPEDTKTPDSTTAEPLTESKEGSTEESAGGNSAASTEETTADNTLETTAGAEAGSPVSSTGSTAESPVPSTGGTVESLLTLPEASVDVAAGDGSEAEATGDGAEAEAVSRYPSNWGTEHTSDFYTYLVPNENSEYLEVIDHGPTQYSESTVEFYCKKDREKGYGGFLFEISVYSEYFDFTNSPHFEELGTLTSGEDARLFNVVMEFPSDVQFDPNDANVYNSLYDASEIVRDSIQGANGWIFWPGECYMEAFYRENYSPVGYNEPFYSDAGESMLYPHDMLPYSSRMYLNDGDIYWMTPGQLQYAINEIYARHGRKFKNQQLQEWFNALPWYQPIYEPEEFEESYLTHLEKTNIQLMLHRQQVNSQ